MFITYSSLLGRLCGGEYAIPSTNHSSFSLSPTCTIKIKTTQASGVSLVLTLQGLETWRRTVHNMRGALTVIVACA